MMEGSLQEDDQEIGLSLSASTFAVLQDFYKEQDAQKQRFEDLKAAVDVDGSRWSMDTFTENWNASQFWYSDGTATALARELLDGATGKTHVAVVSAPSVFVQLKNVLLDLKQVSNDTPNITLFEFDRRFDVFHEFVHYDLEQPLELDERFKGRYDRILCDPPFLSLDCQTKAAMTVCWLAKPSNGEDISPPRLIICTGERMEEVVHKLYPGISTTKYEPQHAQGRLGNEFRCYANYAGKLFP